MCSSDLLIEIKSRMLLPRPPSVSEEVEDPRAELVRRLLEYEQMKKAAQLMDELPQVGRDVFAVTVLVERQAVERLPQVHPRDLAEAWREGEREYASVAIRYAINDQMVERASGRVISGGPQEATEVWTFLRVQQIGRAHV